MACHIASHRIETRHMSIRGMSCNVNAKSRHGLAWLGLATLGYAWLGMA